jgi:hypothetical protein
MLSVSSYNGSRVSSVVEQRFCKPLVGGSNPSPGTSRNKGLVKVVRPTFWQKRRRVHAGVHGKTRSRGPWCVCGGTFGIRAATVKVRDNLDGFIPDLQRQGRWAGVAATAAAISYRPCNIFGDSDLPPLKPS